MHVFLNEFNFFWTIWLDYKKYLRRTTLQQWVTAFSRERLLQIFDIFGHVQNRLDEKNQVSFEIYDVTTWLINNCMHILPNISRSKGNQTMKFGQLIEYNLRNILLKNHTQNGLEKLFPDPYLKYQNWAYLWISSVKIYTVFFCWMLIWGLSKYGEIKLKTTCFYLI